MHAADECMWPPCGWRVHAAGGGEFKGCLVCVPEPAAMVWPGLKPHRTPCGAYNTF
jgi:hypothetical protein